MNFAKPIPADKLLGVMCILQIKNISNWSDFMSIHSHLYLKSGLGPSVDLGSDVERPLEEESWPEFGFTTFSNILIDFGS